MHPVKQPAIIKHALQNQISLPLPLPRISQVHRIIPHIRTGLPMRSEPPLLPTNLIISLIEIIPLMKVHGLIELGHVFEILLQLDSFAHLLVTPFYWGWGVRGGGRAGAEDWARRWFGGFLAVVGDLQLDNVVESLCPYILRFHIELFQ
jgi:hypothetical protein